MKVFVIAQGRSGCGTAEGRRHFGERREPRRARRKAEPQRAQRTQRQGGALLSDVGLRTATSPDDSFATPSGSYQLRRAASSPRSVPGV
jgi:hypothetical protein